METEKLKELIREVLDEPIELKYELLTPEAKPPVLAHPTDSCFDVYATSLSHESNYLEYGTGIRFDIPPGYELKLYPRSSISNTSLMLANSVGVIDETYTGELMVRFKTVYPYVGRRYEIGERIAQIQLVKKTPTVLTQTKNISKSGRGRRGFGSSGSN